MPLAAELAIALHRCGAPAHHLEQAVTELLAIYGASGAVAASPTALWLQVGEKTRVLRLLPGDVDLGRLGRLTALAQWRRMVACERLPPAVALRLLRDVMEAEPTWSARAQRWAFIASSATGGALIGGSVADVLAGALGGAAVHRALGALRSRPEWTPLGDGLVALLAGLFGGVAALLGASAQAVSLASILILLPGLSLTVSVTEIAAGQWSAGGTRLLGVMACLLQLATGLAVGLHLTDGLTPMVAEVALPAWAEVGALMAAPLSFAVLCGCARRESLAVVLLGVLGFLVAGALGGLVGTAAGAAVIGLGAGAVERGQGTPSLVLMVPAVLLLVPGSVGLRGVDLLIDGDVVGGLGVALQALGIAATLAASALASAAVTTSLPTPGWRVGTSGGCGQG